MSGFRVMRGIIHTFTFSVKRRSNGDSSALFFFLSVLIIEPVLRPPLEAYIIF